MTANEFSHARLLSTTMTRVFTPNVTTFRMARRYGLWPDIRNCESAPGNAARLHSPGTFGHGGAFGTEGGSTRKRSDSHHAGTGFGWFGRRAPLSRNADSERQRVVQ